MASIDYTRVIPSARESRARAARWRAFRSNVPGAVLRLVSISVFLRGCSAFSLLPWPVQVPSPADVLNSALHLDATEFAHDLWLSASRVILGFVIAAIVGIPLGIVIGYSQILRDLLFTPVELLRPVPPIAW